MELYLLRHGRSTANEKKLVTGDKGDDLCPAGKDQARAAGRLLRAFRLDHPSTRCFVSDWGRAQETALLAAPDRDFAVEARLGETFAGEAANMARTAFAEAHPLFWNDFAPDRPYPGGESHRDLYDRVLSWQKDLEALPQETTALAVTHAGPICCLLHAACKVPLGYFPMFLAANASLTKLERRKDGAWRLAFFSLPPEAAP